MPKPAGITQVGGFERDVDLSLFRESFDLRGELFAGYRPVRVSDPQDRTPVIRGDLLYLLNSEEGECGRENEECRMDEDDTAMEHGRGSDFRKMRKCGSAVLSREWTMGPSHQKMVSAACTRGCVESLIA